jgi:hypothetical protein
LTWGYHPSKSEKIDDEKFRREFEKMIVKTLRKLKQKKLIDYYESELEVSNHYAFEEYDGTIGNLSLLSYDAERLPKELKRLGFVVID